MRRLKKSTDK
uniref:Uncharacterized protein n=1 Tax=Anguilla anguilla TaxID=7936 RepID=A0A0E9SRL4_ANGAN